MPDSSSPWDKLSLRLLSIADRKCRGHGITVVSLRLLLLDGRLVIWTEPEIKSMEPKDADSCDEVLRILASN